MLIAAGDRLSLPADLELVGDRLVDPVRATSWPVNETARFMLEQSGGTIAEASRALARRFGVSETAAERDVLAFTATLNERLLLNVAHPLARVGAWLGQTARLLPLGVIPSLPRRRVPIPTHRRRASVLAVTRALLPRALVLGVAAALALTAVLMLLGGAAAALAFAPLVGASATLTLLIHEAGHAALLRDVACFLGLAGGEIYLAHPPLPARRRVVVAVAGPGTAAAAGLALLALALLLHWSELALVALVLVSQLLGLTVAARDGRTACGLA